MYHFGFTVTLISDLVFRTIVSGVYLIFFEVGIPNLMYGRILGWQCVVYQFWGHCNLINNPVMSISHIYNLGEESKL